MTPDVTRGPARHLIPARGGSAAGHGTEVPMSKHIACADIVGGCPFEASAATEEELLQRVAAHARESHGVAQVTPELAEKVRASIRE